MLDITQVNAILSTLAAQQASQPELQLNSLSAGGFATAKNPRPTVTWCVTGAQNLDDFNGQSSVQAGNPGGELTTAEALALIHDLASYGVPRLVFAGGEPLLRPDILGLVAYAYDRGMDPALVTRGARLSRLLASALKLAGLRSVSILVDGIDRELDRRPGARTPFHAALEGYANSEAAGLATEIRIPLDRGNYIELGRVLDFIEGRQIRRVVFTHPVGTGGTQGWRDDLTHREKRHALDLILDRAEDFHRRGMKIEVATAENHADGVYYYLRLARRGHLRAPALYQLLKAREGAAQGAGVGIAGIDAIGNVHPDPYWSSHNLGNVRETRFSEIWEKSPDPLLQGLRNRLPLLGGVCANCRWKPACAGNLRVRADAYFGDPWMTDPACYLTSEEISKDLAERVEAMEGDVLLSEQAA